MSRVVLVSNRVLDLSKAARAGGVAVVLANIVRTRKAMWFGWNGEVTAADTHRHHSALGNRVCPLLPWLRQLRAVAGVPQPPRPGEVRGRLLRVLRRDKPPARRIATSAVAR